MAAFQRAHGDDLQPVRVHHRSLGGRDSKKLQASSHADRHPPQHSSAAASIRSRCSRRSGRRSLCVTRWSISISGFRWELLRRVGREDRYQLWHDLSFFSPYVSATVRWMLEDWISTQGLRTPWTPSSAHRAIEAVLEGIEPARLHRRSRANRARRGPQLEELAQDALVTALERWPSRACRTIRGAWSSWPRAKNRALDRPAPKKAGRAQARGSRPRHGGPKRTGARQATNLDAAIDDRRRVTTFFGLRLHVVVIRSSRPTRRGRSHRCACSAASATRGDRARVPRAGAGPSRSESSEPSAPSPSNAFPSRFPEGSEIARTPVVPCSRSPTSSSTSGYGEPGRPPATTGCGPSSARRTRPVSAVSWRESWPRRNQEVSRPRRSHSGNSGVALEGARHSGRRAHPAASIRTPRALGDQLLIGRGLAALSNEPAHSATRRGRTRCKAAIAACHARARTPAGDRTGQGIVALYESLGSSRAIPHRGASNSAPSRSAWPSVQLAPGSRSCGIR